MVRELKNLKLDLYSDLPRIKKVKPPDSEEVERRLMEETINEIVGDSGPLQDNEETESTDFDFEKRCKDLGLIPKKGFKPLVESIAFGSPSLERNQDSNIAPPSTITIHDLPDRNFEMFMSNEGFGEANLQEIAEAGIFDTVNGRQIYDLINNRKSFEEIGEIARRRRATQLSLNTPDIIITDEEELHVIPDKAQQQVSLPANQSILFSDFDNIDMLEPLQAHAPALDQIAEPARFSRRDMFDKIAIEAAHAEKPKRRRKRRRIRQSSPLRIEAEEFLDLNEPLKRHKRQKKKSGPYKPKPTLHVLLDIFEDLSDYGPDRNWVEAEEEEQIEMDYQSRQAPSEQSALGSVQEMRNKRQSVQMPIETPDQVHDAKRQRLDDDVRRIIGFDENSSSFAVPEIAPPVIAATPRVSSIASFHPDITSTVQRPRPSGARLAMDDLLFAEYQEISKENLNPNQRSDIEALVNKLDRHKRIGPTPMKEAVAAPLPESPTRVKRYEKDGEKMIALRNDDGSHEFYTEYNLEVSKLHNSLCNQLILIFPALTTDNVLVHASSFDDEDCRPLENEAE